MPKMFLLQLIRQPLSSVLTPPAVAARMPPPPPSAATTPTPRTGHQRAPQTDSRGAMEPHSCPLPKSARTKRSALIAVRIHMNQRNHYLEPSKY